MQKLLTTVSIHHHFYLSGFLLLFYLLTIREILCMICLALNVLCEVYNPLAHHFQIQNHLTKTLLDNYVKKRPKKLSNNIICVATPHNAYVITPYINNASFSSISRRNEINTHRYLNFPYSSSNPIIIYRII